MCSWSSVRLQSFILLILLCKLQLAPPWSKLAQIVLKKILNYFSEILQSENIKSASYTSYEATYIVN